MPLGTQEPYHTAHRRNLRAWHQMRALKSKSAHMSEGLVGTVSYQSTPHLSYLYIANHILFALSYR